MPELVGEWEGETVVYEPLVRPPLVEAVCEFRFDPSDEWDSEHEVVVVPPVPRCGLFPVLGHADITLTSLELRVHAFLRPR